MANLTLAGNRGPVVELAHVIELWTESLVMRVLSRAGRRLPVNEVLTTPSRAKGACDGVNVSVLVLFALMLFLSNKNRCYNHNEGAL